MSRIRRAPSRRDAKHQHARHPRYDDDDKEEEEQKEWALSQRRLRRHRKGFRKNERKGIRAIILAFEKSSLSTLSFEIKDLKSNTLLMLMLVHGRSPEAYTRLKS